MFFSLTSNIVSNVVVSQSELSEFLRFHSGNESILIVVIKPDSVSTVIGTRLSDTGKIVVKSFLSRCQRNIHVGLVQGVGRQRVEDILRCTICRLICW